MRASGGVLFGLGVCPDRRWMPIGIAATTEVCPDRGRTALTRGGPPYVTSVGVLTIRRKVRQIQSQPLVT